LRFVDVSLLFAVANASSSLRLKRTRPAAMSRKLLALDRTADRVLAGRQIGRRLLDV